MRDQIVGKAGAGDTGSTGSPGSKIWGFQYSDVPQGMAHREFPLYSGRFSSNRPVAFNRKRRMRRPEADQVTSGPLAIQS